MTTGKQGETRSAGKSQGKNASCREGNERVTSAVNQVVKRQTQPSRVVRPPHIFPAQKQFFVWFGTQTKRLVSVYIGPTPQSSPHWRPRPLTPPVPPSNRVNVIHRRPAVSFVWRESWLPCKCKRVAAIIVSSPLTLLQRGELSDKMTQSSCPSKHKFWKFQKIEISFKRFIQTFAAACYVFPHYLNIKMMAERRGGPATFFEYFSTESSLNDRGRIRVSFPFRMADTLLFSWWKCDFPGLNFWKKNVQKISFKCKWWQGHFLVLIGRSSVHW